MRSRTFVLIALMVGHLLSAIEYTIVATVAPLIVTSLGDAALFAWSATGYMVTATAITPIGGKLCDRYGRRRLYLLGLALLGVGSVLCGLARQMPAFIVSRAVQGVGGGILVPATSTILGDLYSGVKRGRIQGLFAALWGVAAMAGPPVAAVAAAAVGWRTIFLAQAPLTLVAALLLAYGLTQEPARLIDRPPDVAGAALLAVGLAALLVAVEVAAPFRYLLLAAAAVMAIALPAVERRAADPLLHAGLVAIPTVRAMLLLALIIGAVMLGAVTFLPLLAMAVMGGTAGDAARLLSWLVLAAVVASAVGGWLMPYLQYRIVVIGSALFMAVGFGWLGALRVESARWGVALAIWLCGIGIGMGMPMVTASVQQESEWEQRGTVTAFVSFLRSAGGTLGVPIAAFMFRLALPATGQAGGDLLQKVLGAASAGGLSTGALDDLRLAVAKAMQPVFWFYALLALCALATVPTLGHARLTDRDGGKLDEHSF